jgi:thiol-disulfide isomerase/thioredoxin
MKYIWMRRCLVLIIMFGVIVNSQPVSAALVLGDPVPNVEQYAIVKPGEMAPVLDLFDLNGANVHIEFKNLPTVLISVNQFNDIDKLLALQKFFNKKKGAINLYFVARTGPVRAQEFFKQHGLTMPVLLESRPEFLRKYNTSAPSMVIVDKKGIVRYNSTFYIDVESLERYMECLLRDESENLPALTYIPPKKEVKTIPPVLAIGDTIYEDEFRSISGDKVHIKYLDKPTVLLFWADFNTPENLMTMLPVMQAVAKSRGNKANFYTVNTSGEQQAIIDILRQYNSTVPAVRADSSNFLKYVRALPAFVIIDQNGVLRYRSGGFPSQKELETLLDSLLEHKGASTY